MREGGEESDKLKRIEIVTAILRGGGERQTGMAKESEG